jgi:hypothetical protein
MVFYFKKSADIVFANHFLLAFITPDDIIFSNAGGNGRDGIVSD